MLENRFARLVSHGLMNIMIGIIGGIFGGISASLLIWLLNYAQTLRELHPHLIFILPIVGVIIALLRGAPKLVIGSFLTHLGGGSAGREGAVIHLSKIFSEKASQYLNYTNRKTNRLTTVSMGAAFGAALGAPWAGLLFGFEFRKSTFFRPITMLHCAIAAVVSQAIIHLTKTPHFHFPEFSIPGYSIKNFALVLMVGILLGLITLAFHLLRHRVEHVFAQTSPIAKGIIGGTFLTLLFFLFGLEEYQGLGKEMISASAVEIVPLIVSLKKLVLSAITLGTGFQGGEYFPLAFIGSTLGSAFSLVDPSLTGLFAGLGFVSVYGAATETPIACTILACELFGWSILPYAAIALWFANQINSRRI